MLLDDLVPGDHVCRVIDAFVNGLKTAPLGFERAEAAETGRPGYDPRDLLKLYLYGYLNQIRSSRRLEAECHCNVELKPEREHPASQGAIQNSSCITVSFPTRNRDSRFSRS